MERLASIICGNHNMLRGILWGEGGAGAASLLSSFMTYSMGNQAASK